VVEGGDESLSRWIDAAAAWLGIEAEPVDILYSEVDHMLSCAGPALLRLPRSETPSSPGSTAGFLVLLHGTHTHVTLITPRFTLERFPLGLIRDTLCRTAESSVATEVDNILAAIKSPPRDISGTRAALLRQMLASTSVSGCWLMRPMESGSLFVHARSAQLPRWLSLLLAAHTVEYGLWIGSWWLLGRLSLQGRLESGWLWAWLLLLLTTIPFHLLTTLSAGQLSVRFGAILRRRLLFGALRMNPDRVRHLGAGHLLGRVLEADAVESMALSGGYLGITAVIDLLFAGFILYLGVGSSIHVFLLLCMLAITFWLGRRSFHLRQRWTDERMAMTNDLIERMVGHRTLLAQEPQSRWNEAEDQALDHYLDTSSRLDSSGIALQVFVPRGWLTVGLLAFAPMFLAASGSMTTLAAGVGGVVLAYRAFRNLVEGLERLMGVAIAWQSIRPFWEAAKLAEPPCDPAFALATSRDPEQGQERQVLLEGHDLVYRYADRHGAVLQGVSLRLNAGERLLLQGPSGGGKSTLAMLLAGHRRTESGLLLLDGLDRVTLGEQGWRRRVVAAPQFHDNHVLLGTFAFNLLMGRQWPPTPADFELAERICRELELGHLLERMPSGLLQIIGDTGWQLSHGEKSRLYIARALLQGAELLILDESFAALDPLTLQRTLTFVLKEAETVMVIAHP
jgi:ATP-binding cassette subfamily B protein